VLFFLHSLLARFFVKLVEIPVSWRVFSAFVGNHVVLGTMFFFLFFYPAFSRCWTRSEGLHGPSFPQIPVPASEVSGIAGTVFFSLARGFAKPFFFSPLLCPLAAH